MPVNPELICECSWEATTMALRVGTSHFVSTSAASVIDGTRYAITDAETTTQTEYGKQMRDAARIDETGAILTKQAQFFYDHAGFSVAQGETELQGHRRSA